MFRRFQNSNKVVFEIVSSKDYIKGDKTLR